MSAPSSGGAGLVATGLRKAYRGRVVVDGVSLEVPPGEVHGLLGPNGAGKSTLFRMLAGVERPDAGTVRLDGRELDGLPLHRRARLGLGWLPQEDTLFPELGVRAQVALAVEASGTSADPEALLDRVGIRGLANRGVAGLSGGERRRLQVARLLARSPRALLLDEPFAGVDPIAVSGLQELVRAIAASGVGVLLTDHAVRETLAACDRVTLLDQGVVQVQGTPLAVALHPVARARYLGPGFAVPSGLRGGSGSDTI